MNIEEISKQLSKLQISIDKMTGDIEAMEQAKAENEQRIEVNLRKIDDYDSEIARIEAKRDSEKNAIESLEMEILSMDDKIATVTTCKDSLVASFELSSFLIVELQRMETEKKETMKTIQESFQNGATIDELIQIINGKRAGALEENTAPTLGDVVSEDELKTGT